MKVDCRYADKGFWDVPGYHNCTAENGKCPMHSQLPIGDGLMLCGNTETVKRAVQSPVQAATRIAWAPPCCNRAPTAPKR